MYFHLAIPVHDLEAAAAFYKRIGGEPGRKYESHVVINFFGNQLVCHLSPEDCDTNPEMYPRHFGIIFDSERALFDYFRLVPKNCVWEEMFTRRRGLPEEHKSFFLVDPSNNLVEFKWYKNKEALF